jgi:hypothetical protein
MKALRYNIYLVRCLLVLVFLLTIFLNTSLWLSDFSFPLVPVFNFITIPSYFSSQIILAFFVLLLLVLLWKPSKLLGFLLFFVFIHFFVTDINRLQPSFYIFSILIVLFAIHKNSNQLTTSIIILFSAIYFWSGIHKYNTHFLETWLGGLDRRIGFVPQILRGTMTYSIPFLEAGFGLSLLFVYTRKLGAIFLIIMHLLIISFLIYSNSGYLVIPLNLLMIVFLYFIIYKSKITFISIKSYTFSKLMLVLLVWILPIGNFFNYWDHFLSFSILSGKPKYAYIVFQNEKTSTLIPIEAREFVTDFNNQKILSLNTWAYAKKGIMVYPQTRVYEKVKDYLNKNFDNKTLLKLIEY